MAFLLEFNVTVMAVEISFSTWRKVYATTLAWWSLCLIPLPLDGLFLPYLFLTYSLVRTDGTEKMAGL